MRRTSWRNWVLAGLSSLAMVAPTVAQEGEPWPFTHEWYCQRAGDPPGQRQVEKYGKLWPPFPRPVGRKRALVHTLHDAVYWPYPYSCQDQAYTRNLLEQQASAGWVSATTLHDYHFNPETQELTDGARNHLIWIAQSVPAQHRTVFVAQGISTEMAQLRVNNSEQFYRDLGIVNAPPIVCRVDNFIGRPANEVDAIRRLEILSIPRPRLFYIGSATSAMGGGGVAGGAGGPTGGAGATTTNGGVSPNR